MVCLQVHEEIRHQLASTVTGFPPNLENIKNLEFCHLLFQS